MSHLGCVVQQLILFTCIAYAGGVGSGQLYTFCDLHMDACWGAVYLTTTKATFAETEQKISDLGATPEPLLNSLSRLPVNDIFRTWGRVLARGAWAWATASIGIPRRILRDESRKQSSKNKLIDHRRCRAYVRSGRNSIVDVCRNFARFENHIYCGRSCLSSELSRILRTVLHWSLTLAARLFPGRCSCCLGIP